MTIFAGMFHVDSSNTQGEAIAKSFIQGKSYLCQLCPFIFIKLLQWQGTIALYRCI